MLAHNVVEFGMTNYKLDSFLVETKAKLVEFLGLPYVTLNFRQTDTFTDLQLKAIKTVSLVGPDTLEIDIDSTSPTINITISGLNI